MNAKEWLESKAFRVWFKMSDYDWDSKKKHVYLEDALEYGERVRQERETCHARVKTIKIENES